jgi:nicotinic acetylcholine receptor
LRSSCKIDVTFFPFDDQICQIKFGSWTYSGLQVDLTNKSNTTDLTNYIISGEWELKKVTVERNVAYYPCCPDEPYPDLIFYIHIRRRILYYLTNIIFPCVWLSILSVIGFWLPPDSGEKITLGITVLLAFSVFMLLIAENIPATSEMIPIICIYLTVTMSLTSLSIILTVLVLNLHHHGHHAPPIVPEKFYAYMTRQIAPTIGMMNIVKRFELNRFKVDKDLLNKSRIKVTNWQDGNYNQFKKYDGSMMRCSCCLCFKSGRQLI